VKENNHNTVDEKEETAGEASKDVEEGRSLGILQGVKEEEEGEDGEKEPLAGERGGEEEGEEGRQDEQKEGEVGLEKKRWERQLCENGNGELRGGRVRGLSIGKHIQMGRGGGEDRGVKRPGKGD